jgi:hypothetical protein
MKTYRQTYFQFRFVDELTKGDVFRFTTSNDRFYTVLELGKEEVKVQTTYGDLMNLTILNDYKREVMVFPAKKRNIK